MTPAGGGLFYAEDRFVSYATGEVRVAARTAVTKDGSVRMATAGMPATIRPRGIDGFKRDPQEPEGLSSGHTDVSPALPCFGSAFGRGRLPFGSEF